ncbi:MAPEG family protein [Thalassovita sp.]|uniref:MAPEG family protein n=1 Tax=Thalassovita sp. TaxID=1979401 RepID=UPI0028819A53|nr:MAPEG family protein [Thalassovita sp.]MDF1802715.1 MAPEG family protein [Thalassovita sp.]
MILAVTPIYAGLLGIFYVLMSLWVVKVRVRQHINSGDKGDPVMHNAIRTHANFAEYVPLALILIGFGEVQGMPAIGTHVLGAALVLARVMHGFGMGRRPHTPALRGGGAALTFVILLVASLANLGHAIW